MPYGRWEWINEPHMSPKMVGWAYVCGNWAWGAVLTHHLEMLHLADGEYVFWVTLLWDWHISKGWNSKIVNSEELNNRQEMLKYLANGMIHNTKGSSLQEKMISSGGSKVRLRSSKGTLRVRLRSSKVRGSKVRLRSSKGTLKVRLRSSKGTLSSSSGIGHGLLSSRT